MARIEVASEGSLLVVTVVGSLVKDEVIAVVTDQYPLHGVKDVIWDLTDGSLSQLTKTCFLKIAQTTKEVIAGGARQGGKTVFVRAAIAEYGLLRMYTAIAEIAGVDANYSVFKTIEEARMFLLS